MVLYVSIEKNGWQIPVGTIEGDTTETSSFSYGSEYLGDPENPAISISLPLEEQAFSPERTKTFFEGLLPEGFTRTSLANRLRIDDSDYLSILAALGEECIGALRISKDPAPVHTASYKELKASELTALAREGAANSAELVIRSHLSLAGASGKTGLYYSEGEEKWYLPLGNAPSTHIVKQSHVRLDNIVANEQLCLLTAKKLGMETAESFIVNTGKRSDKEVLFATKRYDRIFPENPRKADSLPVPFRLHQEDFSQALGISASAKYEGAHSGYMGKMFDILLAYSADPITDRIKLWDMIIFNFLIGNTDGHVKNFSLLYSPDLKSLRLAPAYDMLCTVAYENLSENMAFAIDGIYDIQSIKRKNFENTATEIGLGRTLAMKRFDTLAENFANALKASSVELVEQGFESAESISQKILERGGICSLL